MFIFVFINIKFKKSTLQLLHQVRDQELERLGMLIVKRVVDDVLGQLFSLLWPSQVASPVFGQLALEFHLTNIARSKHLECFSLVDFESEGKLARIKYLKDFK